MSTATVTHTDDRGRVLLEDSVTNLQGGIALGFAHWRLARNR